MLQFSDLFRLPVEVVNKSQMTDSVQIGYPRRYFVIASLSGLNLISPSSLKDVVSNVDLSAFVPDSLASWPERPDGNT